MIRGIHLLILKIQSFLNFVNGFTRWLPNFSKNWVLTIINKNIFNLFSIGILPETLNISTTAWGFSGSLNLTSSFDLPNSLLYFLHYFKRPCSCVHIFPWTLITKIYAHNIGWLYLLINSASKSRLI